jgi:tight adherence protein C
MDWITGIVDWLATLPEDPDSLRYGYSALLGASVFFVVIAVYLLISGALSPTRRRVTSVTEGGVKAAIKHHEPGLLEQIGALVMPKVQEKRANTEALLQHAGFRSGGAVQLFFGIRLASIIGALVLVLAAVAVLPQFTLAKALPFMLVAGGIGFLIPELGLKRLAQRRQDRLRRALPDAMDLLVVCSEAGLGLASGIQRVASELSITHPELADELALFSLQTRAGMDNREALKDLERRTGLEDIQALVAMLLQSMRFGTSIADTLRIFSEELRDKRLQRAQERAARIGTKMLFPLVLFILPSFFLVVLGPPVLGALRTVQGMGG